MGGSCTKIVNELPIAEQRGIRCHAGPDPASSLEFWIPAFAGMTIRSPASGILQRRINLGCAPTSGGVLIPKWLIKSFFQIELHFDYKDKYAIYMKKLECPVQSTGHPCEGE
jgi:hypothetical protein